MSPRRTLGMLLVLAVGGLGLAVTPAVVPAAHAVTGSPPVTVPDSGRSSRATSPSCSRSTTTTTPTTSSSRSADLAPSTTRGCEAFFVENDWSVFAKRRVKPGTYTFTYYACDFSYLTPGTITITVEALPNISVKKIASNPGTPPGHQPG